MATGGWADSSDRWSPSATGCVLSAYRLTSATTKSAAADFGSRFRRNAAAISSRMVSPGGYRRGGRILLRYRNIWGLSPTVAFESGAAVLRTGAAAFPLSTSNVLA